MSDTRQVTNYCPRCEDFGKQLETLLDLTTTVHNAPNATPEVMVRYLEANGYRKEGENIGTNGLDNTFAYYIHAEDTEAEGVWVPLRNELSDWKARCIDAMRALASSMGKTQLRVWYELTMLAETASTATNKGKLHNDHESA